MKNIILFLCLQLTSVSVIADVTVLIHGYLGSSASWYNSGIVSTLQQNGWRDGGILSIAPNNQVYRLKTNAQDTSDATDKTLYSVDLPYIAPVMVQALGLEKMLQSVVKNHPEQKITLVGHSAGGVVARVVIVRNSVKNISRLITIAAPNLGTGRAEEALDAVDIPFPISEMAGFFLGDEYYLLKNSSSLYVDLIRERPGSMLFSLNRAPHPEIDYISFIRGSKYVMLGDSIVPAWSQNLNNVESIQGKAKVVQVAANHGLVPADGLELAKILK